MPITNRRPIPTIRPTTMQPVGDFGSFLETFAVRRQIGWAWKDIPLCAKFLSLRCHALERLELGTNIFTGFFDLECDLSLDSSEFGQHDRSLLITIFWRLSQGFHH